MSRNNLIPGQRTRGFTIVELLIVVVVIAILAAITIVAYNGIQTRATNNSIQQVANAWVKALKHHRTTTGQWINGWTCLGEGYPYGVSGTDTSGTAQCRDTNGTGYIEQPTFKTAIRPYFNNGSLPTPAFVTAVSPDNTQWRRGIHYAYNGGAGQEVYLNVVYKGDISACPSLQGISGGKALWSGNSMCHYTLGLTTDAI